MRNLEVATETLTSSLETSVPINSTLWGSNMNGMISVHLYVCMISPSYESMCMTSFTDVFAGVCVHTVTTHLSQGHCSRSSWQTSHSDTQCLSLFLSPSEYISISPLISSSPSHLLLVMAREAQHGAVVMMPAMWSGEPNCKRNGRREGGRGGQGAAGGRVGKGEMKAESLDEREPGRTSKEIIKERASCISLGLHRAPPPPPISSAPSSPCSAKWCKVLSIVNVWISHSLGVKATHGAVQ